MNGAGLLTPAAPVNLNINLDGSVTEVGNNPTGSVTTSDSTVYRPDGTKSTIHVVNDSQSGKTTTTQTDFDNTGTKTKTTVTTTWLGGTKETVVTEFDKNGNKTTQTDTTTWNDGSTTTAVTAFNADGSTTTTITEKDKNGKVTRTVVQTTVTNADGSKTIKQVTTYPDGHQIKGELTIPPSGTAPNPTSLTLTSATGMSLCPCDDLTADATPEVAGTADAGEAVTVLADESPVGSTVADSSGNWSFVCPHLADGTHFLGAMVTNAQGGSAETEIQVVIDTTAPVTSIVSGPAVTTSQTTASFTFGSTKPGSMFVSRLDGTMTYYTADTLNLSGLALGTHSLVVTAIDPAGNIDPSGVTYTWTVAASSLSVTVAPIPNSPGGVPLTLYGGASDPGSTITQVMVTIRRQSDNSVVCAGPAISTGPGYSSWNYTFVPPPGGGAMYAVVAALDADANIIPVTSSPFDVY
jgi:hypothetical protein